MTVEKLMGDFEEYPRGLRVLAVDDDPICLKLLKTLLQKCQYQVETANQARVALKMLRENKFDLVISDVHMPDMDGFKLLELVGLEMDLPVIMLSANSDPKLVLKGVTHGACDYLVKPVRIEELSNIWQHVIRRKKLDHKGQAGFSDQAKTILQNGEPQPSVHENQDVNVNRKRKDDDEDSEGDDPVSQKKPRVVWSMVLHRKFVAAVNQLGYDKAVPKRILDLMNVEGLTRENVASHLQKYRLYLKRINSDAKHAAAQGIPPYAASVGDMYFSAAGSLGTSVVSPYTTGGMLGRPDSSSSLGSIRSLTSPSLIQLNHARNVNGLGGTLSSLPSMAQNSSLYSGSMNLDQFQMNKDSSDVMNIDQSRIYEASNMLNGRAGSSISILNGAGGFRNHTSHNLATFNSAGLSASTSSILHDVVLSKTQSNSLVDAPFHSQFPVNTKGDSDFSTSPYLQNETNSLLNTAQATNLRWGVQGLDYNHGSIVGGSSNYGIGIATRNTSTFTTDRGSSMQMQQNNKNFAPETRTMVDETFPLGQTKLPDELFTRGYDPFDEMVSSMIKQEEDEAVSSCDFELDDYSYRL